MGKHLTLDQRIAIQTGLERNQPIKAIARGIGKSPRTVARGIKQRRLPSQAAKGQTQGAQTGRQAPGGADMRRLSDYTLEHSLASVVQMDLVIGRIGGKCLLTLHFVRPCFQIARLPPDKSAQSVSEARGGVCSGEELPRNACPLAPPCLLRVRKEPPAPVQTAFRGAFEARRLPKDPAK